MKVPSWEQWTCNSSSSCAPSPGMLTTVNTKYFNRDTTSKMGERDLQNDQEWIIVNYKISTESGEVLCCSDSEFPFVFRFGIGAVAPLFEDKVKQLVDQHKQNPEKDQLSFSAQLNQLQGNSIISQGVCGNLTFHCTVVSLGCQPTRTLLAGICQQWISTNTV